VLRDEGGAEIPLEKELELLDRYLGIEQIRFADRLQVERRIGPETLGLLVPRFLLQPLVENALRHGLNRRTEAGTLRIESARQDGCLRIAVWNDGPPLPDPLAEGFGVSATRERLQTRYGSAAGLRLHSCLGGVEAVVELPAVSAEAG
jgi:LytS/YehU family sensor histidine kinase